MANRRMSGTILVRKRPQFHERATPSSPHPPWRRYQLNITVFPLALLIRRKSADKEAERLRAGIYYPRELLPSPLPAPTRYPARSLLRRMINRDYQIVHAQVRFIALREHKGAFASTIVCLRSPRRVRRNLRCHYTRLIFFAIPCPPN